VTFIVEFSYITTLSLRYIYYKFAYDSKSEKIDENRW